ncbi:MAG: metallophosphoesterase family protein [Phycisphaerales bacterium]
MEDTSPLMQQQVAIISDIHGNLPALVAVLGEVRAYGIRDVVCLGDIVGYGPEPGACLDLVMQHCRSTVQGNHDRAAVEPPAAALFNGYARQAIDWTRETLLPRHVELLQLLPQTAMIGDVALCVHASPGVNRNEYIHDQRMASRAFQNFHQQACLIGHTHVPIVFEAPSERMQDTYAPADIAVYQLGDGQGVRLKDDKRYICNPGAVGQPRDHDPRASFGILDVAQSIFSVHRVEYDVHEAQRAANQAGLPRILADRLAIGA